MASGPDIPLAESSRIAVMTRSVRTLLTQEFEVFALEDMQWSAYIDN